MKKISLACLVLILMGFANVHAQTNNLSCIDLTKDLFLNKTDTLDDHSVRQLQTYLQSKNYLRTSPNGRFGPATQAAVKAFQKDNSITSTGRVGPLTRRILKTKSCSSTPITPVVTITATTTPVAPTITNNPVSITSPASGSTLTIGKTYTISWNPNLGYIYNIVLERVGGSGAGFIANNQFGSTTYSWQAGKVFSSAINDYQNVATGTYRIHIEKSSTGMTSSDYVSGWFTLNSAPLSFTSMTPQSAPNNARNPVVLYGTGFDSTTIIRFDGQYGIPASASYVSPDGTVIVFSVPTYITTGLHQVTVDNPTGVVSNSFNLTVTSAN